MSYKNVVITGASTGLGFALAKRLAISSHNIQNIIVTARDSQRLESAVKQLGDGATAQLHSFTADLSTTEGTGAFVDYLENTGLQIDGRSSISLRWQPYSHNHSLAPMAQADRSSPI